MKARATLSWVCVGLLVAATARAETLEEAWQLALAHDASLAAAQSDAAGAGASLRAAKAARWPTLDASAAYSRFGEAPALDVVTPSFAFRSPPLFDEDDFLTGGARVTLPLYTGGSVSAGIAAARAAERGATSMVERSTQSLKLGVAEAYVDVLRAQRGLQAAEANVQGLTAHTKDVQSMNERELVATADLLAARVALADAEQNRMRAHHAVELARAAYNRYVGRPLDAVVELEERMPIDPTLASEAVEKLLARSLAHRPELAALTSQAEALASQSRAEQGRRLPQVALTAGYTHLENQILDRQDFSMVGVGFEWRLFDGGAARNRAIALRDASRAAGQRRDDLQSLIQLEVRQAWLGVREAQGRILASREAVSQADENLRMSRELYGAGLATNTQVLQASALRIAATNNRDDAGLDESLALLRLARAVGAL